MKASNSGNDFQSPGFRYVLEACAIFGAIGGLADVSCIVSRNPDLSAEFMQALRFFHFGAFLTSIAFLIPISLVFVLTTIFSSRKKLSLVLFLSILYFAGIFIAGLIIIRSFAHLVAKEGVLVEQVNYLFYFLKYLLILVPVSWAAAFWMAQVRVRVPGQLLIARLASFGISSVFYLALTPNFQLDYILGVANQYSKVSAGSESAIITLSIFSGSLLMLGLSWWLFPKVIQAIGSKIFLILWFLFLIFPYIPPIVSRSPVFIQPHSGKEPSGKKHNVILVSLDTVRYDDTGLSGNAIVKTPNLDKIVEEGICYDSAITPMPLTGPAHISMFTGLQPDSGTGHGVKSNGILLPSDIPTLASILNEKGYQTAAIIGGFPLARVSCGLDRGFNYYHDVFNESIRARFLPDQIWNLTISKIVRRLFHVAPYVPHGLTKSAQKVTDEAIKWLENNSDKPFFLFVHYFDAHYPYLPPPPYDSMYMPEYNGPYKDRSIEWSKLLSELPNFTKADFDYFRALYRGEISYIDNEFGRLIEWIKNRDLWNNTLLIVVSDHGESFEHDYYFAHSDRVYESLIRVPLIIKEPGEGRKNARVNVLVNVSDIFYTVLASLDVKPPASPSEMHADVIGAKPQWDHNLLGLHADGVINQSDEYAGQSANDTGWDFITSQSYSFDAPGELSLGRFFSFRFPDWKLIYGPDAAPRLPEYQYFKLDSDPDETRILDWTKEKDAEAIGLFAEILREWAESQGDLGEFVMDPSVRAQLEALSYIQGKMTTPD